MSMEDTIRRFPEQFAWEPVVEHNDVLRAYKYYVICGMGGSQLGPMLIETYGPAHNLILHKDYGLPYLAPEVAEQALFIMSSYSGTTEETIDAAREAFGRGHAVAAVSTGGKLIEFAKEHALPHIVIPEMGLQPRLAIGFSMLGLARLMGDGELEGRIRQAGTQLNPMAAQEEGMRVAHALHDQVPLFYASTANMPLAYIWKIKINETSKSPAFCNVVPEMCHNELCGMDVADSTRGLTAGMTAVFLEDEMDHERNKKRMRIAGEILTQRGLRVIHIAVGGRDFDKAFHTALMADWVSYELAKYYGVPDEATPLIADFKGRMS